MSHITLRVLKDLRKRSRSSSGKLSSPKLNDRSSCGSSNSSNMMGIINHGEFNLLVLGASGVGKTSICRRYCGYDFIDYEKPKDEFYDTSIFIQMAGEENARQYDFRTFCS